MSKVPIYKRVLLKFSGEALAGESSYGIEPTMWIDWQKKLVS